MAVSRFYFVLLMIFIGLTEASLAETLNKWQPCHVANVSIRLECINIEVPKQSAQQGDTFVIHVVKVAAAKSNINSDPLVFLAGGPGQAASDVIASVLPTFRRVQTYRDILFIDQRGTGKSQPLICPNTNLDILQLDINEAQTIAETKACAEQLNDQLGFFSTEQAVDDLEFIRQYLEIPKFNLYGGSYGSRVAQVYMRKYPNAIRSVILDAVAPMNFAIGNSDASVNASWLGLIHQCEQQEACQQAFPNLSELMQQAQQNLSNSTTIKMVHPSNGKLTTAVLDQAKFLSVIRNMLYHPSTRALIPYTIKASSETDYRPLASQLSITQNQTIANSLFFEIACNEDFDLWQQERSQVYEFDNGLLAEQFKLMCQYWPKHRENYQLDRSAIQSDIPTILISGEYDPVTPPQYAEAVAKGLRNSKHIVVNGAAHTALFHSCLSSTIDLFINSTDVNSVDTRCLDDTTSHWFMTGNNLIE